MGVVMIEGCRVRFDLIQMLIKVCFMRTESNVLQIIFTNKISELAYPNNHMNEYCLIEMILSFLFL